MKLNRRRFVQWILVGWAALGTLSLAGVLLAYLYPPALRRRARVPVEVPDAGSLPVGDSVALRIDGEPALLLKTDAGYRAYSLTCTHLGCVVRWRPKAGGTADGGGGSAGLFVCPCHGGVYDAQGRVVSGPPPRPLDRLDVQVRDGRVFIA